MRKRPFTHYCAIAFFFCTLHFASTAQDALMGLTTCTASTLNPALTGWNPGWTSGIGYKTLSSPWNSETVNIYGEYGKGAHAWVIYTKIFIGLIQIKFRYKLKVGNIIKQKSRLKRDSSFQILI